MSKLRLGVKTIYFPFLFVCVILIGTLVLSGMQNTALKNVCVPDGGGRGHLVVVEPTTEKPDSSLEFSQEIETRRLHANEACDTSNDTVTLYRDVREHLLYNAEANMVFCYVPKVASTVWKTVFHLIDKPDISQNDLADEMLHMRKGYIHTVRLPWMAHIRPFSHAYAFLNGATRVVFTRDPYARLFSAYVDKLLLPSFWKPVGIAIVKSLRRGANTRSKECGHDVTFEEFLRHVTDVNSDPALIKYGVDDHWMPVSHICQPCQMDYDFIGKIETFSKDRDAVLSDVMGLSQTVEYLHTNKIGAENFLNQAINTSWFAVVNFKQCVSKGDIMNKLWLSFQIQGYLPTSLSLPTALLSHKGSNSDTKESFRRYVLEAYNKNKLSAADFSKQRRQFMAKAYRNLPSSVKAEILRTFLPDFEIFDYEQYPFDLYENDQFEQNSPK